jgi:hypothetical protein
MIEGIRATNSWLPRDIDVSGGFFRICMPEDLDPEEARVALRTYIGENAVIDEGQRTARMFAAAIHEYYPCSEANPPR